MYRRIDEKRMNASKEKSIDFVLSEIKQEPTSSFFSRTRMLLITSLVVVIALVVMFTSPNIAPPGTEPIVIQAYESEKIAEISYLTSSFIGSNITVNNDNLMFLSTNYVAFLNTEFEDNDEQINLYFDTLKVFLEDDMFNDSITIVSDEENPNVYIISYFINDLEYTLTVTFTDETFIGTLEVNGVLYEVNGTFEQTDEEMRLEFEAINGNDYVHVEFQTESKEDEVERKYQVEQRINNVTRNQEFKISKEDNEQKVEISDGENEYQLKKELEDGVFQYKLEYKINGVEGSAVITETADGGYHYQIKEGDNETEVDHGKPDYDHDKGNSDEDEDEEDEEGEEDDSQGNNEGNGNSGNNQNTYYEQSYYLFVI